MIASDILSVFCQFTLVFTFSFAAFKKIQSTEEFVATIETSFKTSNGIARILSYLLIVFEVIMALAMVLAYQASITWVVMIALFVLFFSMSVFSVVSGKKLECNCFGETTKMGWPHAFRNLLLLSAAVYCFIFTPLILPTLQTLIAVGMSLILLVLLVSIQDLIQFLGWK